MRPALPNEITFLGDFCRMADGMAASRRQLAPTSPLSPQLYGRTQKTSRKQPYVAAGRTIATFAVICAECKSLKMCALGHVTAWRALCLRCNIGVTTRVALLPAKESA